MPNIEVVRSPDGRSLLVDLDSGRVIGDANQPSYVNPATGQPRPVNPPTPLNLATVSQSKAANAQSQAFMDALTRGLGEYQGAVNRANLTDTNALGEYLAGGQNFSNQLSGIAGGVRSSANNYNNASLGLLGGYASGLGSLNARDQSAIGDYLSYTNPLMTMMTARPSDPTDVQRQLGAYNLASAIAGGSLDYQAALSQAVLAPPAVQAQAVMAIAERFNSDPADVARQLQGYQDLRGIGQGSLDYAAKPEDLAEQKAVLEKHKALSDPEVTAKERFLSELARREFEAGDKSSRDAVSQNLAMRGLRSGGQQIAMQQAARSQLSQDRLLKELGIQAQAVDRAQTNLQGWGSMANVIRGQNDAISANNQATRLQGYAGAAQQSNAIRAANDAVGMFNTAEQNATNRLNATNRTNVNMFNAGETNATNRYNAGLQTQNNQFNAGQINNARANNQQTRMQGANLTAMQSNAIRQANDQQRQFEDTFRQFEAGRVGNLATQRTQTQLMGTANEGSRLTGLFQGGQGVLDSGFARDTAASKAEMDALTGQWDIFSGGLNAITGTADRAVQRAGQSLGTMGGVATNTSQLADDQLRRYLTSYGATTGEQIFRGF